MGVKFLQREKVWVNFFCQICNPTVSYISVSMVALLSKSWIAMVLAPSSLVHRSPALDKASFTDYF